MTLATMYGLTSHRLNEGFGAGGPVFYPTVEIVGALNEAQAFFCLLTLILEKTATWTVAANTTFFHMLTVYSDWLCPLRVTSAAGSKIRPAKLDELSALDPQWPAQVGAISRYAHLGVDLMAVYGQPASPTPVSVTYARGPVTLAADSDVPEIPAEYHPQLVNYAIYRVRQVEGAEEFAKVMALFDEYLTAAGKCADYDRARNRGAQYDKLPFELASVDKSALLKLRRDLVPSRMM